MSSLRRRDFIALSGVVAAAMVAPRATAVPVLDTYERGYCIDYQHHKAVDVAGCFGHLERPVVAQNLLAPKS